MRKTFTRKLPKVSSAYINTGGSFYNPADQTHPKDTAVLTALAYRMYLFASSLQH